MNKQFWVSALHSFLAGFITSLLTALASVGGETLLNVHTWTTTFVLGVIYAAIRAGIKTISPLVV